MSALAMMVGMTSCQNGRSQTTMPGPQKQEREFLGDAIRHHSPDVQRVDLIGNTVVYTHIFDGIIDVKTYTYDGDVCVEAERIYTFPTQMSALRHYRRAVEQADLYDNIEMFKNQVKYDLKEQQHELETKGLTSAQLKAKFDQQISDAKADAEKILINAKNENDKMVKSSEDAIRQAGRNLLISFRESVAKEANAIIAGNVTAAYSAEGGSGSREVILISSRSPTLPSLIRFLT